MKSKCRGCKHAQARMELTQNGVCLVWSCPRQFKPTGDCYEEAKR